MNTRFYEPRKKDGKIVAFADVDVADGVTVKGFRVVQGERGLFAGVPQRSFTVDGRTRYAHQVVFSNAEARTRFLVKILEDYQRWERDRPDRLDRSSAPGPAESHAPADELVE
ncbi:MAG: septation protein SpoVG family protein [Vicinamibacteria bacterium]